MIRYLSAAEIQAIAVSVTGIDAVVRDTDILNSAAGRPQHTFDGVELYPDLWTKAGCLIEGVARNHSLVDGNKRTAWLCGWIFLKYNGINPPSRISTDSAE